MKMKIEIIMTCPKISWISSIPQLVIHDGCLNLQSVQFLLSICRKIVGHFRHSPLATQRLREIQIRLKLPTNKLIQDVPTRWNYTEEMLDRLNQQREAIVAYDTKWSLEHSLTSAQWRLIEKLINVLEVFKVVTLKISESNSLLSEVLPTVKSLKKSVQAVCESDDQGVKTLKTQLLDSLDRRFSEHQNEEKLLLATAVDPRWVLSINIYGGGGYFSCYDRCWHCFSHDSNP